MLLIMRPQICNIKKLGSESHPNFESNHALLNWDFRRVAITVIGGLFTSTPLTLVVLPVSYELAWKQRKEKTAEVFLSPFNC